MWKNKKLSDLVYDPKVDFKNDADSMSEKCPFCHALKCKGQTPGMCCSSEKVQLEPLQPPAEPLSILLTDDHSEYEHFIDRSGKYNDQKLYFH